MSARSRLHLKASATLLAVWTCVGLAVTGVARKGPSERRILQELRERSRMPTVGRSPDRGFPGIAAQLNRFPTEERQGVLMSPELREFSATLSKEEKVQFLQLLLAKGFTEMMAGFEAAPLERRVRWMNQALNELEQLRGDADYVDDAEALQIAQTGLTKFWQTADSTTRIEILPLLERIQSILQVPR